MTCHDSPYLSKVQKVQTTKYIVAFAVWEVLGQVLFFSFKKMNEKPLASGQNYLCKAAICTKKDLKDDEVFFLSFFQL